MGMCGILKNGFALRKDAYKTLNVKDRRATCGVVFVPCMEGNLTDSGSNPHHQFQGILTPESR